MNSMKNFDINEDPHRRFNPLNEWFWFLPIVQRHSRAKRKHSGVQYQNMIPNVTCVRGMCVPMESESTYDSCLFFENDFAALKQENCFWKKQCIYFFRAKPERGISRVVCFLQNTI
jgi:UDPglucose--hexose-1-phosphate uridylyltransferase